MSTTEQDSPNNEYVRLLVANQRRIHGFIRTLLPFDTDADDVLQQASVTGWKKYEEVSGEIAGSSEAFVKWACAIARYEALKFSRKKNQSGRIVFSDLLIEELADGQENQSEYLELRNEALVQCVAKLPDRDRELLRRRYIAELSAKQIAAAVGRSVNNVYASLQRIRLALLRCTMSTLKAQGEV